MMQNVFFITAEEQRKVGAAGVTGSCVPIILCALLAHTDFDVITYVILTMMPPVRQ